MCIADSTAYEFGPDPGLITFAYPVDRRPDSKNDLLALGFSTTNASNATLVRIDSGTSNDYMELSLIDGRVQLVYNLGTEDHRLADEFGVKVNDGAYHVLKVKRQGANSSVHIDNHSVMTKSPLGRQFTVFNSHSTVQIGGRRFPNSTMLHPGKPSSAIEKPFRGIIAGLVFNSLRLLDLAAEDDPRITMDGDVKIIMRMPGYYEGDVKVFMRMPGSMESDDDSSSSSSSSSQTLSAASSYLNDSESFDINKPQMHQVNLHLQRLRTYWRSNKSFLDISAKTQHRIQWWWSHLLRSWFWLLWGPRRMCSSRRDRIGRWFDHSDICAINFNSNNHFIISERAWEIIGSWGPASQDMWRRRGWLHQWIGFGGGLSWARGSHTQNHNASSSRHADIYSANPSPGPHCATSRYRATIHIHGSTPTAAHNPIILLSRPCATYSRALNPPSLWTAANLRRAHSTYSKRSQREAKTNHNIYKKFCRSNNCRYWHHRFHIDINCNNCADCSFLESTLSDCGWLQDRWGE